MSIHGKIEGLVAETSPDAVGYRRSLHRWPEAGFKEYRTSAFVAAELRRLGLDEVRTEVAGTGVVGVLKGGLPGRTVAIRADMDGLPIEERTGLPFKSEHDGWMHGCGHDVHMAGALATASVLMRLKGELPGTVRFLFQPAEEGPGGALPMIEAGAMDGVDMVLGGHVWGGYLPGQVALRAGAMFAAPDEFRIKVRGVGGHAAAAHIAVDTIPIAANIVNALQTIPSRRAEPGTACVVAVGTINAGYRFNVIADTASITGTVRTFDAGTQDMANRSIVEMAEGIASSMGATAEVEYIRHYPPLVNDEAMTAAMRELAVELFGAENVFEAKPLMIGEDFSYFLRKVPGTFLLIGAATGAEGLSKDLHHPCFCPDERALATMMTLYSSAPFRLSCE